MTPVHAEAVRNLKIATGRNKKFKVRSLKFKVDFVSRHFILCPLLFDILTLQIMSIIVENITKLYGQQKALDDVSFKIDAGEVVGLLGPNGAGKSTMMKIITCYIPPTSGQVTVNGFDIFDQSIEVRKRVGYLPENNPALPRHVCERISGLHFGYLQDP